MIVQRRGLLLGGSVALLAAGAAGYGLTSCNQTAPTGGGATMADDISIGAANAPVTLIEYASLACPHCKEFEETVFPRLKQNYIDTGKVRFIMREFPTAAPPDIVLAEFQVARCNATPDQYYTRISALFAQRDAIFASGTREGVRAKLIEFGKAANLSEEQVLACIGDEAGAARFQRVSEGAQRDYQVNGTPALILNGQKLNTDTDPSLVTYEGLSRALDAALAAHH